MELRVEQERAQKYLSRLIGQPLTYGIKSPDMDLYDFGFGGYIERRSLWTGKIKKVTEYILHFQCEFDVVCRMKPRAKKKRYDAETSSEEFSKDIYPLLGLTVKRVGLGADNDLLIEIGDYWLVFLTWLTDQESWRFFTCDSSDPHLVVADTWLELHS